MKNIILSFLIGALVLGSISCKKSILRRGHGTESPAANACNVSLVVETDFPYYYVLFNGGATHTGKENPNGKKRWEKSFKATIGETITLTTETITSNLSGSRLTAKILINGKVADQAEKLSSDCPPGAPCNRPLLITLKAVAK
jgi:hypothetical protein